MTKRKRNRYTRDTVQYHAIAYIDGFPEKAGDTFKSFGAAKHWAQGKNAEAIEIQHAPYTKACTRYFVWNKNTGKFNRVGIRTAYAHIKAIREAKEDGEGKAKEEVLGEVQGAEAS